MTIGCKEKVKVWTTFWSLTVCSHQVSALHNAPNNRAVSFIAQFKGLSTAWPLACLFWRLPETSAITQDNNQLGKTGAQQKAQPNLCQRNVKSQSGFTKTQAQEEVINVQWVNDQLHRYQGLTLQTINLDQIKQKGNLSLRNGVGWPPADENGSFKGQAPQLRPLNAPQQSLSLLICDKHASNTGCLPPLVQWFATKLIGVQQLSKEGPIKKWGYCTDSLEEFHLRISESLHHNPAGFSAHGASKLCLADSDVPTRYYPI